MRPLFGLAREAATPRNIQGTGHGIPAAQRLAPQ